MPSIANQDFKIYGLLDDKKYIGVPGEFCGELYAALARSFSMKEDAQVADGFVITSTGDGVCRPLSRGIYYDFEAGEWKNLSTQYSPAYYDALWAIQQAIFAYYGEVAGSNLGFELSTGGELVYGGRIDYLFRNEDGYLIKGTVDGNGKLASLYLGDKADEPGPIVRLESLLPLVGELPLDTTKIW